MFLIVVPIQLLPLIKIQPVTANLIVKKVIKVFISDETSQAVVGLLAGYIWLLLRLF